MCLTELADPEDWQDCSALMTLVNNGSASNGTTTAAASGTSKKPTNKSSSSTSSSSAATLSSLSVYGLHHGDIVQCRVLSSGATLPPTKDQGSDNDKEKNKDKDKHHKEKMQFVNVSLRPSRLSPDGGNDMDVSSSSSSLPSLEVGSLVSAFVANISLAKGCFLRLPGGATGQVRYPIRPSNTYTPIHANSPNLPNISYLIRQVLIKDLDDEFVTDPVAAYPPGTLVRARVLTQASHSNNDDDNDNENDNNKSSSIRTSMPILTLKVSQLVIGHVSTTINEPPLHPFSYFLSSSFSEGFGGRR